MKAVLTNLPSTNEKSKIITILSAILNTVNPY